MASADKYERIIQDLRRWIVDGAYKPGERLPTSRQFTELFNGSSATIQRAMKHLARDGFVRPCGRRGTFVADHPPHLCHFGVVLPSCRCSAGCPFVLAVKRAVAEYRHPQHRLVVFRQDADGRELTTAGECLGDYLGADRLAGALRVCPAGESPTCTACREGEPGLLLTFREGTVDPTPVIRFDYRDLLRQALAHLAAAGCRRPAVIAPPGLATRVGQWLPQICPDGTDEVPPYRVQTGSLIAPVSAANLTHLLVRDGQSTPPDGLVLMAEQFLEPALAGLAAAGVAPEQDVRMVVQGYFPRPDGHAQPVTWHGWDMGELLAKAIDDAGAYRRGLPMPPVFLVPPNISVGSI